MAIKIAVIGAGIVGLNTAVRIIETFGENVNITILTKDTTPNTTGDGSAGTWTSFFCIGAQNDQQKLHRWGKDCFQEWLRLWKAGLSQQCGIALIPFINLSNDFQTMEAPYKDILLGWTAMNHRELCDYSKQYGNEYKSGSRCVSFICEVKEMLPFLIERFKNAGGQFKYQHVTNFNDIAEDYDVIVNCTGLGAQKLTNDPYLYPIRGQSMRIDAPWLHHVIIDSTCMNQIAPNINSVFLGGTDQKDDYNQSISHVDSMHIHEGCKKLIKSIENAKILWEWVGLRPTRNSIRLEMENLLTPNNKTVKIIHNYGHGGSGVTLSWGCGGDVVQLLNDYIQQNNFISNIIKSKI